MSTESFHGSHGNRGKTFYDVIPFDQRFPHSCHVVRQNFLLWEKKSLVIQRHFIVPALQNMAVMNHRIKGHVRNLKNSDLIARLLLFGTSCMVQTPVSPTTFIGRNEIMHHTWRSYRWKILLEMLVSSLLDNVIFWVFAILIIFPRRAPVSCYNFSISSTAYCMRCPRYFTSFIPVQQSIYWKIVGSRPVSRLLTIKPIIFYFFTTIAISTRTWLE